MASGLRCKSCFLCHPEPLRPVVAWGAGRAVALATKLIQWPPPRPLCPVYLLALAGWGPGPCHGLRGRCSSTLELAAFPLGSVPTGVSCTRAPTGSPMLSPLPAEVFATGDSSALLKDFLADTQLSRSSGFHGTVPHHTELSGRRCQPAPGEHVGGVG